MNPLDEAIALLASMPAGFRVPIGRLLREESDRRHNLMKSLAALSMTYWEKMVCHGHVPTFEVVRDINDLWYTHFPESIGDFTEQDQFGLWL